MSRSNRRIAQKVISVVVIVAVLQAVGLPPAILTFLVGVGILVWQLARSGERRETQRIFRFYVSAEEVLRDEDRRWYKFELVDALNEGDCVLNSMPDPPPLCYFVVGALCYHAGDYANSVEYLTPILQPEWLEERRQAAPSPQLRRYVEFLRSLEREPVIAPEALKAVRSLELMQRTGAARLLMESRKYLTHATAANRNLSDSTEIPLGSIIPPPSISDVLREVYPDEQTTH